MLYEGIVGSVGRVDGKHDHILLLLACSGHSLWTGRRDEFVHIFNGIQVVGRLWRSDVDSSCSATKDIDGGRSPEQLSSIKRDLYGWLRNAELVVRGTRGCIAFAVRHSSR